MGWERERGVCWYLVGVLCRMPRDQHSLGGLVVIPLHAYSEILFRTFLLFLFFMKILQECKDI